MNHISDSLLLTLSPQQRRILRLIGEGMTNPAIAVEMDRSSHTVENHIRFIRARLGIRHDPDMNTRVLLVRLADRLNVLEEGQHEAA